MNQPRVSFIVPVRNDAPRLRGCLESIRRNDYPSDRVEMVVVDNGSTDSSAEVARRAGALVLTCPSGSVAKLRNLGARVATGDFLAFVDADHEIDAGWTRCAVLLFDDPRIAATGAPYATRPDANWVQRRYSAFRPILPGTRDVQWLSSGNLIVKREVFELIGGFDASLVACEDVELCNRIRHRGFRILADPRLRSVHFGDPATLRALFFGELWRGRDNLRVTLRGAWTVVALRSALIALFDVVALVGLLVALTVGHLAAMALLGAFVLIGAGVRSARLSRNDSERGATAVAEMYVVTLVYDLARALALLIPGSHRLRRSSSTISNATANTRT